MTVVENKSNQRKDFFFRVIKAVDYIDKTQEYVTLH